MDHDQAARWGRWLFFLGSAACLGVMFTYLTPATLAYINQSNHLEDGRGVPADVVRGKQAFHKFVCMDCHTILGDGTQYAPELGRIAISRDAAFLKAYMRDAQGVNPKSGMPSFKASMSEQEADDLVAFLTWSSKINLPEPLWQEMKAKHDPYDPRAYEEATNPFFRSYWPPRPMTAGQAAAAKADASVSQDPKVAEGAKLFHQNSVASCDTCHQVGGVGGAIGPALDGLAEPGHKSRFGNPTDRQFLETKLVDPGAESPQKTSAMPSFKALTAEQREALLAYLTSLKR